MKTRSLVAGLAALIALMIGPMACNDETPAGPEMQPTTPEFAKQGKGPKPKATALPLTVEFESDYSAAPPPANAAANRLLGDGIRREYNDGVEGVEAFVRDENADESIISGSTWLAMGDSDTRTFWVDLRPGDGSSVVVDPDEWIEDACGTEGGDLAEGCESTQYLNTRIPTEPGPRSARMSVFLSMPGDSYQYRMTYGKTCRNDEIIESNQLDVTEIKVGSDVVGWLFEAGTEEDCTAPNAHPSCQAGTTQDAWVLRLGRGKNRNQCLGRVKAPFKITFMLQ